MTKQISRSLSILLAIALLSGIMLPFATAETANPNSNAQTAATQEIMPLATGDPVRYPQNLMNVTTCNEAPANPATNLLDGNPNTIWQAASGHGRHTTPQFAFRNNLGLPGAGPLHTSNSHWIMLDLNSIQQIHSVQYTPRPSGGAGTFARTYIYVSDDAVNFELAWGPPTPSWANDGTVKTAQLADTVEARYVMLLATQTPTTNASEIGSGALLDVYVIDDGTDEVLTRVAVAIREINNLPSGTLPERIINRSVYLIHAAHRAAAAGEKTASETLAAIDAVIYGIRYMASNAAQFQGIGASALPSSIIYRFLDTIFDTRSAVESGTMTETAAQAAISAAFELLAYAETITALAMGVSIGNQPGQYTQAVVNRCIDEIGAAFAAAADEVITLAEAKILMDAAYAKLLESYLTEASVPAAPVFSADAGFYAAEFDLVITGSDAIHYTLDGSEPTLSSPRYNGPIRIYSPAPTTANSPMMRGARPQGGRPHHIGMVVKARAFSEEGLASNTVTRSYFVERDGRGGVFNSRVISISMEPEYFVDPAIGMYHNFLADPRHMAYAEVFYPGGEFMLAQSGQARISGHYSRNLSKKSIRMNFNSGGSLVNNADFIPDTRQSWFTPLEPVTRFRHFTARVSDWQNSSTIRDTFAVRVNEALRSDGNNSTFTAIYVNGEFWGMYCLREHRSVTFVEERYPGIPGREVVALEIAWDAENNQVLSPNDPLYPWRNPSNNRIPNTHPLYRIDYSEGSSSFERDAYASWMQLWDAITDSAASTAPNPGQGMANQANYEYVKEIVDMDNMIDYFLIYYHMDNDDWPGNNFLFWRTENNLPGVNGGDTKWRFFAHDFDMNISNANRNRMYGPDGHTEARSATDARMPTFATDIWRCLFQNEEFRSLVAARYATYLGTAFHPSRTRAILTELLEEREDDITKDFHRWNLHGVSDSNFASNMANKGPTAWRNSIIGTGSGTIRNTMDNRGNYSLTHIREYYNRSVAGHVVGTTPGGLGIPAGFTNVKYNTDKEMGFFDISGAQIRADLFDRDDFDSFDHSLPGAWVPYAFRSPGDFGARYLRNLPIEISAVPYEGFEFSHFEVTGGPAPGTHTGNPLVITPGTAHATITVNAVFEEVIPDTEVIAEFRYTRETASVASPSYPATDGVLKGGAGLQFFYANGAQATLGRTQMDREPVNVPNNAGRWFPAAGEINANNSAGWLITLNTKDTTGLVFSADQGSSNNGPRDFNLAYRIGTDGPFTEIGGATPHASVLSGADSIGGTFARFPLPAEMEGRPVVQLKAYISSTESRGTGTFDPVGGNTSMNNIVVSGIYTGSGMTYEVTFKDHDGTVLKVDTVLEGGNAAPPPDPWLDGYVFKGWSGDYSNVTANIEVTAQYEPPAPDVLVMFGYTRQRASAAQASYPSTAGAQREEAKLEFFYASGLQATIGRTGMDREPVNVPNNAAGWFPSSGAINANNSAGWVVTFSTAGFANLAFSADQGASNSGPRDFNLAYRIGTTGPFIEIGGATPNGSILAAGDSIGNTFDGFALPAAMENKPIVQLKAYISTNVNRGLGVLDPANGNTSINNIIVTGTGSGLSTYTITFEANGGRGSIPPVEAAGDYPVPDSGEITRSNHSFTGWSRTANGSDGLLSPGTPIAVTAPTTLYAQWTRITLGIGPGPIIVPSW